MAGRIYKILRLFSIPVFKGDQVFIRKLSQRVQDAINTAADSKPNKVETVYKSIMRIVPQPVVVVTTGYFDEDGKVWNKRGMTCTSFTNVSFQPPILSMCLKIPSQMNDLLLRTQQFAVHVLANHQASLGMTFAQHPSHEVCPFESIPHIEGKEGVPLILGSCAILQCKAHSMHTVGDHNVWYGFIEEAEMSYSVKNPLLYYTRSFRSVGDEIFLKAFEDVTLPFEDWTHKAHLRMAWNYIHELGLEGAEPRIKSGIKKYNQQNKDKVQQEYHETVTMFYILIVTDAINRMPQKDHAFEHFLHQNGHLLDKGLMFEYYSQDRIFTEEAQHSLTCVTIVRHRYYFSVPKSDNIKILRLVFVCQIWREGCIITCVMGETLFYIIAIEKANLRDDGKISLKVTRFGPRMRFAEVRVSDHVCTALFHQTRRSYQDCPSFLPDDQYFTVVME